MRLNERYIFSMAVAYALTTAIMAAFNEDRLDLYLSVYIIEYFILTLLHSPLKPKAGRILDSTGYALFVVFVIIVSLKVWEILFGVRLL
jgi:hypothetical protein